MKAVVFGGGNIGRGLVAPVLQSAGFETTIVDADTDLIARLDQSKTFTVLHTDGHREVVVVTEAIKAQDEERVVAAISEADLIATAVGGAILPILASPIRHGLEASTQSFVNVIACENTHPNSALLKELIGTDFGTATSVEVGFPEVVVDRIVIPADGLDVTVEPTFEFLVDMNEWVGKRPPEGIELVDDVDAYVTRKLWLVNGLHVATALKGLAAGYEFIHEAIADPTINADVGVIASNMVSILASRFPQMDARHIEETAAASLHRFSDGSIADPLIRVARNPVQKLAEQERILGPALAAVEAGLPIEPHARVLAAAFQIRGRTTIQGADALDKILQEKGWQQMMQEQGVSPDSPLMEAVEEEMSDDSADLPETIVILNPSGLHARPASQIVEHMKSSEAKVTIQKGEKTADAGSILSVLTLGASSGDEVTISGSGANSAEAIEFIKSVLLSEEEE